MDSGKCGNVEIIETEEDMSEVGSNANKKISNCQENIWYETSLEDVRGDG